MQALPLHSLLASCLPEPPFELRPRSQWLHGLHRQCMEDPEPRKLPKFYTACQLLRHERFSCLLLSMGCACVQISEKLNADSIPCSLVTGAHARGRHPAVQQLLCLMGGFLHFWRPVWAPHREGGSSLLVNHDRQMRQHTVGPKHAACSMHH